MMKSWGSPGAGAPSARAIRLQGGKWGAEVHGSVERGDVINLTLENGETEHAVVGYVRWRNASKCIVELET